MIWAIVHSQSCFCWLYRASPSLDAKDIINLISVLTIWWCPCVESSLVLWNIHVCVYIYIYINFFLIYSSVSGRLDCFHILAVVNSAAIDIGLKYLFLLVFSFSSIKYPELLDQVVVIFEFLMNLHTVFDSGCNDLHFYKQ